ncbi:hypothetical protein rosag_48150 [Roseisolibacter agri]|uniref:AAA+ ATPase domain-containing protein n=1 Tax=Roseisolibacter agri TaxID=2014610 RepID=A0AA37V4S2_9BACT|nr:hypothetical protein rosag_48150 [Roseisolibacter agri]
MTGLPALAADKQLAAAVGAAVSWQPPMHLLDLTQDGVYTLRGQRQVGKSTYLKLVVKYLLEQGWAPRRILYADVEAANATRQGQLQKLIKDYLDDSASHVTPGERRVVLLDEVTGIKNWQTAIRVLADAGALVGVTVLATGSNCKDVKTGGDRLPRRRGNVLGRDLLYQPLSFRDYLAVTEPAVAHALPTLDIADAFVPERLHAAAQDARHHDAVIAARFHRYLATGGFLASINEEVAHQGVIPEYVYRDYRAAVLGEVARLGRRESNLRAIVGWLRGKLGQAFEWRTMAQEAQIARHETAQDLVEDVESAYVWHLLYRTKTVDAAAPTFKSPKRLYPLDPFTWHMLDAWSRNVPTGWEATQLTLGDPDRMGALAEAVAVDHVRRLFGPHCYYYRSDTDEEIDLVATRAGATVLRAEVKYRNKIDGKDQAALRRHGGGVLLSKHSWHFAPGRPGDDAATRGPVVELPIPHALALWPCPSVFAAVE